MSSLSLRCTLRYANRKPLYPCPSPRKREKGDLMSSLSLRSALRYANRKPLYPCPSPRKREKGDLMSSLSLRSALRYANRKPLWTRNANNIYHSKKIKDNTGRSVRFVPMVGSVRFRAQKNIRERGYSSPIISLSKISMLMMSIASIIFGAMLSRRSVSSSLSWERARGCRPVKTREPSEE